MWRHDAWGPDLGLDGIWFAKRNEWSWRGTIFWPNEDRWAELTEEEWVHRAYNYHP